PEAPVDGGLKRVIVGVQEAVPHGGGGGALERGVERTSGIAGARLRGVDIAIGQCVDRLGADVADTGCDIARQLALHDEVPRLDVAAVQSAAPGAAVVHGGWKLEGASVQIGSAEE